jgi:hypothetical protein
MLSRFSISKLDEDKLTTAINTKHSENNKTKKQEEKMARREKFMRCLQITVFSSSSL